MANFGGFAAGLAQGLQGLPGMLQQKSQEELRQAQFAEQMKQQKIEADSKFFTEARARLDEVIAADPEQAAGFADFVTQQWEQRNNVKVPSLFRKQLKEDPAGTLDALATAGPEKAREVMGDPQAFMNFFPSLLKAKAGLKAKEQERVGERVVTAGPTIAKTFREKFPGYSNAVEEAATAETQLNMAIQEGASTAQIAALQKRVDFLKEKLDKGMPDDVKKAIIEFGSDPRSASIEEQQKALQNMRVLGVKQAGMEEEEKAYRKGRGENRAFLDPLGREAAQLRVDEAGFTAQAKRYGEIIAGLTPQGRQAMSLQLSTDLQKQAFEKDYTAAEKIEQNGPTLVKSKQVLANLAQALKETGPGGRITGEMKKKVSTMLGGLIPSEKVAAYDTIDQLVTEMGIQIAMQLRPITQKELQLSIDLPPNVRHTEEGRARMFNAMNLALDKELELVGTASKWKGKVAQGQYDTPWSTEYSSWLNKWGEPPPSNVKPGSTPSEPTSRAPLSPQGLTRLGIDSLPPTARTISSAQAFVESRHDMDAVGKAGELSAWQIKPETASSPGLPGVRPLSKEELKDPVKAAQFNREYLMALTREFDGNLRLGLAAYNAGPGNIRKYIEGGWNDPKVKGAYLAGLNYADKVLAAAQGEPEPEGDVESRKRSLLKKGGRIAAEVVGSMAGGGLVRGGLAAAGRAGMRGAGALALTGEAVGTAAGSLAANLFDPVADAKMEAATAGLMTLASGPFGSLIHKLVGPKGLTENGRSLIRLATARGIADDVPAGSALEGKLARNMAGIADDASFSNALQKKKAFLQNEFKLQGDMYAAEAIAQRGVRDTFMQLADETLGAVKLNMKPIYKHIDDTLREFEKGTIRLEPETIKAFNQIRGGKGTQTLLQLDQLKQSLWQQWSKEVEQGNYGGATKASRQIGMLADYIDEVIDGALKGYPVERQYYKVGKEAALEVMQGNHMSWVLANAAKNSPEGIPDGKALLRLLNEGQKGPVKLTGAQRENMTELAKAFIALQDKPSTFRIVARGLELGGLAALVGGGATALASGDPSALTSSTMLGGLAVALVPSTLAKIMASRPATKLLTRALIEKPGSELQYRASSQLLTMMANEGWLIDDRPAQQQQQGGQ